MSDSRKPRWGNDEWHGSPPTEDGGGRVDIGYVFENPWHEGAIAEAAGVARHGAFVFGGAIDVVENARRKTPLGKSAKIVDIGGRRQSANRAIAFDGFEADDGTK